MRTFSPRPALSNSALIKLDQKTVAIVASATPADTADTLYTNSRKTKWFENSVVAALRLLAGLGERCMFCGGSEASQVDHFKPKANYPRDAMVWENFVWICGFCNQHKGNDFPLDATGATILLNPLDDDVWTYFRLDKFGYLSPRWDAALDDFDPRAKKTEDTIKFNRQAAQEARYARFKQLEQSCNDWLALHTANAITAHEIFARVKTELMFPLHQEVPQYYFKGDGKVEAPFSSVRTLIDTTGLVL
jgi:uncharacterized protein (TIGR02646 family)